MLSTSRPRAFTILLVLLTSVGQLIARGPKIPRGSWPDRTWKLAKSPEKAGWSSERLAAAKAYGETIHTSAVMIVQGGEVVDQWGDFDKKITSYSVRKSLISALYGIYSAEGVIDLNQTLEQLKIDDFPDPLTRQEKSARIVDILRARSGVYHPVAFESPNQIKFRPARDSHAPGTFWFYNNWDFNVLGTIFEKKTGKKIGQAFYERVAKPIGMQDFKPEDVFYLGGPESMHPAFLFEITARDLARFGLLYLRQGTLERQAGRPRVLDRKEHARQ